MKRSSRLILLVLSVLLLGTLVSAATEWDSFFTNYNSTQNQSGQKVDWAAGENNAPIPTIYGNDPTSYTPDAPTAAERASITLNAIAYIPTYVKLQLSGNAGKSTVHAFGPITKGEGTFTNDLVFDNEIGGFVDNGWNSVGHGDNIEIGPEDGYYIQASDYLKAVVFSNSNYKYEVVSSPLTTTDGKTLDLEMGYNIKNGELWGDWSPVTFNSINKNVSISSCGPLQTLTVMHRFRVPYNDTVVAGQYTGKIYFKVYTL